MDNKSWVLIANSSNARLFSMETLTQLNELHGFVHPQSRLTERDLVDAKPGRSFDRTGPHRHSITPRTLQKDQEVELFAKSIAKYLEEARKKEAFSRLYIAAGPTFLGVLRKALSPAIAPLIQKEISKDLVHLSTAQILSEIVT